MKDTAVGEFIEFVFNFITNCSDSPKTNTNENPFFLVGEGVKTVISYQLSVISPDSITCGVTAHQRLPPIGVVFRQGF